MTERAVSLGALLRRARTVVALGAAEAPGTVLLIASERTGPDALTVETAPGRLRPGSLELTILVEHANTVGAVADARVIVEAALGGRDTIPTTIMAVHDAS